MIYCQNSSGGKQVDDSIDLLPFIMNEKCEKRMPVDD